jgi:predicted deacylase
VRVPRPGKRIESFTIPAVGTHNSIPPFTSAMRPGVPAEIQAVTITGEEPGPSLYVGGGQHGDEIGGMAAAREVAERTDPKEVSGRLVVVPLQNPAAFRFRSRLNPFDPIDPDWVHPGDPKGSHYQRVKHVLNGRASGCDCVVDLHTAGMGGANSGYVYVPPELGNGAGRRSLQLARAFGGDRILQSDDESSYGWPVKSAMPFVANRDGRMGLYAEAGQGGATLPERRFVEYLSTGVFNVMKKMGMIPGDIVEQGERLLVDPRSEETVEAPAEGLLRALVAPGDSVHRGQVIAEIDLIPLGMRQVRATASGAVIYLQRVGSISKGDTIATISPRPREW